MMYSTEMKSATNTHRSKICCHLYHRGLLDTFSTQNLNDRFPCLSESIRMWNYSKWIFRSDSFLERNMICLQALSFQSRKIFIQNHHDFSCNYAKYFDYIEAEKHSFFGGNPTACKKEKIFGRLVIFCTALQRKTKPRRLILFFSFTNPYFWREMDEVLL